MMNLKDTLQNTKDSRDRRRVYKRWVKECTQNAQTNTYTEDEFVLGFGFFGSHEVSGASVIQRIDDLEMLPDDEAAYTKAKKKVAFLETPGLTEHFPDTPTNRRVLSAAGYLH